MSTRSATVPCFRRSLSTHTAGATGRYRARSPNGFRNVVEIGDPKKPFHSHRHTAISYLRNTVTPDGHPVVKEDVERYLTGHAGKGAHAGYGKQWIETLKAAIEIIPNPLLAPLRAVKDGASAGS